MPRLALLLLLLPGLAAAQGRRLTVETNAPDARVYVDSVLVGTARQGPFDVADDARRVALRPPAGLGGLAGAEADIPAGPAPRVRLDLPYHYRIESQPFDARVMLEAPSGVRRTLGTTPLELVEATPLDGVLVLERAGYAPARITPGAEVWNRHSALLTATGAPVQEAFAQQFAPRRLWLDAALVGVAAAATAVSVRYKFEANDLFAQYRETGDPALRPRIRHRDLRAGWALGVAGVALGAFSLRLALRR